MRSALGREGSKEASSTCSTEVSESLTFAKE